MKLNVVSGTLNNNGTNGNSNNTINNLNTTSKNIRLNGDESDKNLLANNSISTPNPKLPITINNLNGDCDAGSQDDPDSSTNSSHLMEDDNSSSDESKASNRSKSSLRLTLRSASNNTTVNGTVKRLKKQPKVRLLTAAMINQSILGNLITAKNFIKMNNPTSATVTLNRINERVMPISSTPINNSTHPLITTVVNKSNIVPALPLPITNNIKNTKPANETNHLLLPNEIKVEADEYNLELNNSGNVTIPTVSSSNPPVNGITNKDSDKSTNNSSKTSSKSMEAVINKLTTQPVANSAAPTSNGLKRKSSFRNIMPKPIENEQSKTATTASSSSSSLTLPASSSAKDTNTESTENANPKPYDIRPREKTVPSASPVTNNSSTDATSSGPSVVLRIVDRARFPGSEGAGTARKTFQRKKIIETVTFNKRKYSGAPVSSLEEIQQRRRLNESNDSNPQPQPGSSVTKSQSLTNLNQVGCKSEMASPPKPINQSPINMNNQVSPGTTPQRPNEELQTDILSEQASLEDLRLTLFRTALRLAYLNTCGIISDSTYDFVVDSMPIYNVFNPNQASQTQPNTQNSSLNIKSSSKNTLNKLIIDHIDTQTSSKVSTSPLYSLILQTDDDFMAIYVYIQFLDHQSIKNSSEQALNLQQKRFIRLINLKPFQQLFRTKFNSNDEQQQNSYRRQIGLSNEVKFCKYLFEQLKLNVINQFKLIKQNLMCISLETRLLDCICFPTFQLYLNDLLHNCILIIPNYQPIKSLNSSLNDWKQKTTNDGSDFSIKVYFKTAYNLIKQIRSFSNSNSEEEIVKININQEVYDYLDSLYSDNAPLESLDLAMLTNLPKLTEILDFIYTNYSKLVEFYKQIESKDQEYAKMNENINSIDFYFMTCLLCDLCKFLYDYQLNPKRFSSSSQIVMPWNFNGSYLNNLLSEQLFEGRSDGSKPTESETQNESPLKRLRPAGNSAAASDTPARRDSTIEFDKDHLDHLHKVKQSMEKLILDLLDFCSEKSINKEKFSYLTTSNSEDDSSSSGMSSPITSSSISMVEIYSSICQMFDINIKNIQLVNNKYQIKISLNDKQFQSILDYYEFKNLIDLNSVKNEYKQFFETFFENVTTDLKTELGNLANELNTNEPSCNQLYESYILARSLLDPNTNLKRKFIEFVYQSNNFKFCPVVSFLATIYLCLPSIVDFRDIRSLLKNCQPTLVNLKGSSQQGCGSGNCTLGTSLTPQELIIFENKLKYLSSFEHTNCSKSDDTSLIQFDDIPFIDTN